MAELLSPAQATLTAAELAEILGTELRNATDSLTVTGFSTDTRTVAPGNCFLALKGETFDGNQYAAQAVQKGAALCILSEEPAEALPCLLVKDTVQAYATIARAFMQKRKAAGLRVVGITGSSGKTTVKDMTAHVLSQHFRTVCTTGNFNNHIGVPRTVLGIPQKAEIAVVEMGMNHTGEISHLTRIAQPDLAIITNIGTAHIGNLGSQENIFRAKMEITEGMADPKTMVFPAEDAFLSTAAERFGAPLDLHFSTRTGLPSAELSAQEICENAESTSFSVQYQGDRAEVLLPMTGLHNVTDALLAIHAGLLCGMSLAECAEALCDFTPGAMRSERLTAGSFTVIRDCYNANPEAMRAALQSLGTAAAGAKRIAVLGNMNELGTFAQARHREIGEFCRTHTDAAFFCGDNYRDFAEGYGSAGTAFAQQEEMIPAVLEMLRGLSEPAFILVKASRGLHLEKSCEAILTAFSDGQKHA